MPVRSRVFTTIMLILAVTAPPGATASAAGPTPALPVQAQVNGYLAAHPGGHQINATEIAYGDGAFIVAVTRESTVLGVADCPSGWFCFYDGVDFRYPRGRLSDCGWQDLGWWGWRNRTESAHYNLSTGSVTFINETGSTDTSLFSIGESRRAIADVAPSRNKADYVYRYC